MLITSRRRGRWILPKGWPMSGLSLAGAAAREAEEEAGVAGEILAEPIGSYDYKKETQRGYKLQIMRRSAFVHGGGRWWPPRCS